jgi:hypothetical protein
MADQAQVASIQAIEAFRARLIVYVAKTRALVDEVSSEVQRTRQWLQGEQHDFWARQLRQRLKKLEQANSELTTARLSTLQEATASQQMAVRRARDAVHEAEAKLSLLRKWDRDLANLAEPLVRQTNSLQHALNSDMPQAVAHLEQLVQALDAYRDLIPTIRKAAEEKAAEGSP